MPESSPRLRVVYPPGSGRGDCFRGLADTMDAHAERVRRERAALHEEYCRHSAQRPGDERPDVPADGMCQADRLVALSKATHPRAWHSWLRREQGGASA